MMPIASSGLLISHAVQYLPSIFLDALADPAIAPQFSLPWIEGKHVFATDGALVVCYPVGQLADATVRHLPRWSRDHPVGMLERMQQFGPFHRQPSGLPPRDVEPDVERPDCEECGGFRDRRPRLLAFKSDHACPACGGSGVKPLTGRGVWFLDESEHHPKIGLDAWYVTLLRRYGALLFAPLDPSWSRIGPFRFTIGLHCWGLVQPKVESRSQTCRRSG